MTDPRNAGDDADEALRLFDLGRDAIRKQDYDAAAELLRRSMLLAPHPKTAEHLGECLRKRGAYNEAILYLSAAIGLGSRPAKACRLLAEVLHACGKDLDAYRFAQQAVAFNASYRAARELLSVLEESAEVRAAQKREEG